MVLRSLIALARADGLSNMDVAASSGVSRPTVGRWRSRFIEGRLGGLVDEDRPGALRKITDEQVVVAHPGVHPGVAPESIPESTTHWSRTWMAKPSAAGCQSPP